MAEKAGYKHFMLKEIFEQPHAVRETILGRVSLDSAQTFLDEIAISADDLAAHRQGDHRRLRHLVARRARRQVHDRGAGPDPGRGRLRLRVPLPQPDRHRAHAGRGDHAVGRDRRHARRAARGQGQGRAQPRHLQRRRQHGHARSRGHALHARRAGDRRGLDQGVHQQLVALYLLAL